MADTPENAPEPLKADTHGYEFELPSYDIAPEDQELADEIAAFDPVWDTNGPTSVVGAVKMPANIKATGLPPHLRDPILQELAKAPASRRDAEEQRLVNAALYENSYQVRVAAGPGAGADAYQREFFLLEHERYGVECEIERLGKALGEKDENATVTTDPHTGQQRVETRDRIQGHRRAAMEAEYRRAVDRLGLLRGSEAERRLAKAKHAAVAEVKAFRAQIEEDREARERADGILREERVSKRAEAYAKHKRIAT